MVEAEPTVVQEETKVEAQTEVEEQEIVTPPPTGPYLYGDQLSAELTTLQLASRGDEDALEETKLSVEEAKDLMNKFKKISRNVETFRPSFPETTTSELIGILNVCIPVKKYLTWNLMKLIKRAIQEVDLDLLRSCICDVQLDCR